MFNDTISSINASNYWQITPNINNNNNNNNNNNKWISTETEEDLESEDDVASTFCYILEIWETEKRDIHISVCR